MATENATLEKALNEAAAALNRLNNRREPALPRYVTEGELSVVEQHPRSEKAASAEHDCEVAVNL